jgi:hypothetical protein
VPIVRRVWVPVAMSYHAKHLMLLFPEALVLAVPIRYQKPLGEVAGSPRQSQAGGNWPNELTGGEIVSCKRLPR